MFDGQIFYYLPLKNDLKTYDNARKITIGQGDGCTTCCLLDYPHFKQNYKLIATNLSKQQALEDDPKAK